MENIEEKNKWYNNIIELFELNDFLSVIERDEKGNPVKVSGISGDVPNKLRIAENENDFEEIYQREFSKLKVATKNINFYINEFKEVIDEMIMTYKRTHSYKLDVSNNRDSDLLNVANSFKEYLDSKLINLEKVVIKDNSTKKLSIQGKKLNISERYMIANHTLDLYKNINNRNISQTEKHILMAHILGCSQQVARELFNGTQQKRTPVREEIINKYLDTLK